MSKKFYYFPILKTTNAELKAYSFLNDSIKNNILPIFELTKSQKTKKNPESKLEKKLEKLYESVNKYPFIVDLTTETTYSNKEIERMIYDGSDGYKKWVNFLKKIKENFPFIIPMVHYHPQKIENVKLQTISLGKSFKYLAFRVDIFEDETLGYIKNFISFCKNLQSHNQVIIILDGSFIHIDHNDKLNKFKEKVKEVNNRVKDDKICAFVYTFSSFPKSVRDKGYNGGDSDGAFEIKENKCQNLISYTEKIYHGDYGSIHPARYDTGGGGWIPRIDVVSSDEKYFFYRRYRRNDGSYNLCAKKILQDEKYQKITQIDTWGDEEIHYANQDKPRGKNPSHWIAVRSNLYMTRQYFRLKKINQYLSLSW